MYIYHFWPLCMHCKKTTTIRCFLKATYDLLVVLRKPWICTLCFDAHFSKFRDFWWFLVIFNRKMDILDHFWGPLTASSPKVTIYLPLSPWTLSGPLKKSIFVILPIRGQWKCHFDPILTPFWALLSQTFGLWPKCAYLGPLPGWTLEGPWGSPNLT